MKLSQEKLQDMASRYVTREVKMTAASCVALCEIQLDAVRVEHVEIHDNDGVPQFVSIVARYDETWHMKNDRKATYETDRLYSRVVRWSDFEKGAR